MHRSYSSKPYDILHGINVPANISSMFTYLSYFPPPPPLIPGPPPRRSWTCSSHSLSSSSCFVSDDLNPPSLRTYVPLITANQSSAIKNTSPMIKLPYANSKISPFVQFVHTHLTVLLLLMILISILLFSILFFSLFLYIQRVRQRRLATNDRIHADDINNNNSESNHHSSASKHKNFYYHLIPYREKTTRKTNNEVDRTNHDSSILEVIHLTKSSGTHRKTNIEEQEEAL
ncbi:unnamed protein product [Adineta ricciae]|uniref:Uncharacterized protein n=1 Tax=Adineta ricciae TaxID=249248 RepID=A0A816DCC6_ADIRI|nr:unnamed protein product [Adineta ricciae]